MGFPQHYCAYHFFAGIVAKPETYNVVVNRFEHPILTPFPDY
tara:strand:+ start:929 stop:1054 length:126 start_codon:yes stop_codon:yes gene_type:complete